MQTVSHSNRSSKRLPLLLMMLLLMVSCQQG